MCIINFLKLFCPKIYCYFSSFLNSTKVAEYCLYIKISKFHRPFTIEPLTGKPHIITSLWKRFLKFINCISLSQQVVLRDMLHLAKQDCRSITGRNRRKIELMANQDDNANKHLPPYCMIPDDEKWRIALVREISEVANFTTEELDTINKFACCS